MAGKATKQLARSRLGRIPPGEVSERDARILDAATAVFLERGFAGATVTAIAKQAGCSLETLYTTYANKAQMFTALTTRRATGLYKAIGPLKPERDLREALLSFAVEVLALIMRPDVQHLHRLVIAESRDFPELGRNFWKEGTGQGIESLRDFFEAKASSGEIDVGSPQRAAEVFVALVFGVITMKSVVGLRPAARTNKVRLAWAEYSVDLFMKLLDAKAI